MLYKDAYHIQLHVCSPAGVSEGAVGLVGRTALAVVGEIVPEGTALDESACAIDLSYTTDKLPQ